MRTLTRKPLQIYLNADQEEPLRSLAQRLRISMAELIRQSVDRFLADLPVEDDPAMRLVGLGSGPADLAESHDHYLVETEIGGSRVWPEIFVDTGAWIALANMKDSHHDWTLDKLN